MRRRAPSTAVTSSDASTAAGEPVTLTATISPVDPAIGIPASGTVDFLGTPPFSGCDDVAVDDGIATCMTSALPVGTTDISASYSGVTNYAASTALPFTQTVRLADTTTTLESSDDSSAFTAPVTFTATVEVVEPGAAPLTGTVLFQSDSTDITACEAQPLSSGIATCTTSGLPLGESTITAIYSGTEATATSSSPGLSQVVGQATTSTALTSAPNPSVFSQSVVFTATVDAAAPSTGTPVGTVSFSADELTITGCGARTLTSGVATCTVPAFEVGDHNLVATYAETAAYASSSSEPVTQTVNRGGTTTAVATSDSTTTWSEGVTYTATIAPVSPATGTASGGTVNFRSNGTSLTGCAAIAVSSGTAACTTSITPVGSPSITAVFSGDDDFTTSTSSGITQTVARQRRRWSS